MQQAAQGRLLARSWRCEGLKQMREPHGIWEEGETGCGARPVQRPWGKSLPGAQGWLSQAEGTDGPSTLGAM